MHSTSVLRAQQARVPLIKFLGKRHAPKQIDHTPHPHPVSPTHSLPESFASYRSRAQQHGPMGGNKEAAPAMTAKSVPSSMSYGPIGGTAARKLGSIKPKDGEYFDRSELPKRFAKLQWSDDEMEAITSAGASLWK